MHNRHPRITRSEWTAHRRSTETTGGCDWSHKPLIGILATNTAYLRTYDQDAPRLSSLVSVSSKDDAMATRGIFQKSCPSCAAHVSINEQQCRCGYSFRTGLDASEIPVEEDQAQQQLLREYVK